ncbi:hypothetical protein, partial [Vibrio harveyi]|uniref:hypothetical protein n=1 Tax=Vibrio harveyi TaxID=669 RepID=UPI001A7E305B
CLIKVRRDKHDYLKTKIPRSFRLGDFLCLPDAPVRDKETKRAHLNTAKWALCFRKNVHSRGLITIRQ